MSNIKIMVPVDGSRFAEAAVPAALSLAADLDAEIELVSVFEDESILAGSELTAQRFKECLTSYLADLVKRMGNVSKVAVSFRVIDGMPTDRLVEYAARSHADLVVMSTHGRGAISRTWLGSVADRVVRQIDVPVLLVRLDENDGREFTGDVDIRNILVALDGSQLAEQSLDWAIQIAKPADASLTLVRTTAPPILFTSPYIPHAIEATQGTLEFGRNEAATYLAGVAERLREDGLHVETEVLVATRPAHGILAYVKNNAVDLIVITTHGRTGLSRAFLGSVAHKILRAATTPVLLVRPTEQGVPNWKIPRTERQQSGVV